MLVNSQANQERAVVTALTILSFKHVVLANCTPARAAAVAAFSTVHQNNSAVEEGSPPNQVVSTYSVVESTLTTLPVVCNVAMVEGCTLMDILDVAMTSKSLIVGQGLGFALLYRNRKLLQHCSLFFIPPK